MRTLNPVAQPGSTESVRRWLCVVRDECASDQGEYGLAKVVLALQKGHPSDASHSWGFRGFDDPNLVSCAGLAPELALAERCGLHRLVADSVTVSGPAAANASVKVPALVAGMIAGADSIDDMDLLRHGGMGRLFGGVRAPSTLGSFLRTFRFGHARQLDAVAARLLANLASHIPLLRDADQMTLVDADDTVEATYGYAKQGAGYGYTKVKGLNALIATVSTPISAPVIVATRLRRGSTNSARGAARLVADALTTAKRCGAGGLILTRCDSAFYNADVVATTGRAGARFSITARQDRAVRPPRPGQCWDNALAESFFAALKNELVYRTVFPTAARARRAVAEYIEVIYNRVRLHSGLGYNTPAEAAASFHQNNAKAG